MSMGVTQKSRCAMWGWCNNITVNSQKSVSQQWDMFHFSRISCWSEGQTKMSAAHPPVPQNVQRGTAGRGESTEDGRKWSPYCFAIHIISSGKSLLTDLLFHVAWVNLLYNTGFMGHLQEGWIQRHARFSPYDDANFENGYRRRCEWGGQRQIWLYCITRV